MNFVFLFFVFISFSCFSCSFLSNTEQSTITFSVLPDNVNFQCLNTSQIVSQQLNTSFTKELMTLSKLTKLTLFIIDFSQLKNPSITNISSNNLNCILNNNTFTSIICSNKTIVNNFTVTYTLSLKCSTYCSLFNDSLYNLFTFFNLTQQNQLVIQLNEKSTLQCKCNPIPPPYPPINNTCQGCTYSTLLFNQIPLSHISFQNGINTVIQHYSYCNVTFLNNTINEFIGNITYLYNHHWKVTYSKYY